MNAGVSRDEHPASHGGLQVYAWVVLFFNALFLFYKYVLQISPSVMTDELMRSFHLTAAGLGNLAAMYFYTFMLMQVVTGPLLDRFSPKWLTVMAITVCATGFIGFAHAHVFWQAAIFRALVGVGVSFATVSYLKQGADWFPPRHYAFVAGLLATAVGLGALMGQVPLATMVEMMGWRSTISIVSIIGFGLAILYCLVVRDPPWLQQRRPPASALTMKSFLVVFTSRHNWLLAIYSGLAFSPMAVFGGLWGNPFVQVAYHVTRSQSASYITASFIGLAVGAPILGWISDRMGTRLLVMCSSTALSFISLMLVIYHPFQSMVLLAACLFLFGFGTGGFMLGFAMGKDINPPAVAATVIAMINTGDAIFGASTEPLVGKFLDLTWDGQLKGGVESFTVANYHTAFIILCVYLLLSIVVACGLRGARVRVRH